MCREPSFFNRHPCLQQFVLLWDGKECSESRSGNDCRNPIVGIESERKVIDSS